MKVFLFKLLTCTAISMMSVHLTSASAQNPGAEAYPVPSDKEVLYSFGFASESSLPNNRLSLLVWNLHKGKDEPFKDEYLFLAQNRDIVMNQEILLDQNMTDVFKLFPDYFYTTATSFYTGQARIRTGVANVSTVRPVFNDFVRTKILEPVVSSPKVTLISSYPIKYTNKKLTVVNIHGINFVTNKSFKAEIHRIYEAIKDIPAPLIWAGDFNTWNSERQRILAEYCKLLNLKQAKFSPDFRMRFNGYPLDHFLHTDDLRILSAKAEDYFKGSDHKPLDVELEYLPQRKKQTH